jgi:tetratricopeptide (TPR) repeat protein
MKFLAVASRALMAFAVLSTTLQAQRDKEPKRPALEATADTNDSRAYYRFAMARLKTEPQKAADALYWSTRLEPTWADAYYARRIALLLTDVRRLSRYWSGDRRTIESTEIRQIDSLFYHALTLNPFVSQTLERELYEAFADEIARQISGGVANPGDVRYAIDLATKSWGSSFRAWLAYSDGRYDDALRLYAQAIKEDKRNGPLHMERGRIFFNSNRPDSALASLTAAIEDMRKRDKKDLVFVYRSKALTEHSIGVVHQRLGNDAAAREAFGRALQEDLSYYPAHMQLAFMALEAEDTAQALSEFDLVTQLRPDDAALQYLHGFALATAGRTGDSEPHIKKAITLNPVYAAPRFIYARLLEIASFREEAIAEFKAFLAIAARTDPRREEAEARLAALAKAGSGRQ